ncbi:MAG TPA: hypothetical protein VMU79_15945 [Casimicrobiaceae bacterium]|jgi:hypothetical protein|nr:hypothetical protein [Casimicrobiaceae bacterium]
MRRNGDKIPAPVETAPTSQQPAVTAAPAPAEANSIVEKCVNCQYYDRKNAKPTDGKAPLWGQCRRHAPHLNPVTAKAYVVEGVWPLVRDDDWCGEWEVLTRMSDWAPEALPVVMQSAEQPIEPQPIPQQALPPAHGRGRHAAADAATVPAGDD